MNFAIVSNNPFRHYASLIHGLKRKILHKKGKEHGGRCLLLFMPLPLIFIIFMYAFKYHEFGKKLRLLPYLVLESKEAMTSLAYLVTFMTTNSLCSTPFRI